MKRVLRSIRLKEDTAEYFVGKPLDRIIDNVKKLDEDGEIDVKKSGKIVVKHGQIV